MMENYSSDAPKKLGCERLLDMSAFPEEQRKEAIGAIIAELQNRKENPSEFYAKFGLDQTTSKIILELAHENSFKAENTNKVGNPSGKDRKAIYDLVSKKVDFLLWR